MIADNQHYIAQEKEMKSLRKRCSAMICAVAAAVSLAGCGVSEKQAGVYTETMEMEIEEEEGGEEGESHNIG